MAKSLDELAKEIMEEFEKDGEPITEEEAKEMATMEIGAKEIKRYEQSAEPKKERKPRERKVDNEKLEILKVVAAALENEGFSPEIEREVNVHFANYTLKLTRHKKKTA